MRFLILLLFSISTLSASEITLLDTIKHARSGDFIVTYQNKTYTLLCVTEVASAKIAMEEISIPSARIKLQEGFSWRQWAKQSAPLHASWLRFAILFPSGSIVDSFSLTDRGWQKVSLSDSFLPTLLNLRFEFLPEIARRRTGNPALKQKDRPVWNPPMIVDGKPMTGVLFDVWRAHWPKDGGILSNKTIDVYLPKDNDRFPIHFPYWLQVQGGVIGNTQIRIIDSGRGLVLPTSKDENAYGTKK